MCGAFKAPPSGGGKTRAADPVSVTVSVPTTLSTPADVPWVPKAQARTQRVGLGHSIKEKRPGEMAPARPHILSVVRRAA